MNKQPTKTYDFGEQLDEVNLSDLMQSPSSDSEDKGPAPEKVRQVAEKAGWESREGRSPNRKKKVVRKRRTYRTGRSDQFNNRCHPDVIQGYYDIADQLKIPTMGETLERALNALRREVETQVAETTKFNQ
ncbi:MAG: hypothetical protein NPIRA03_25700 [Nitrospirales bacterium]|nr:MAG: hypothetical protein NPIRA03_25700 [Nitrospirales bacterium]